MTGAEARADMFIEPDLDPRTDPPAQADERGTLSAFLRWQRETLELKCADLSPEQLARRAVEPSTMSLLGLIRHMADVERGWFRRGMAGDKDATPVFSTKAEPDLDFDGAVADPEAVTQALLAWRGEIAFAERFVADARSLDITFEDKWRGDISLRWVLVHMIEEYARHNGHADLLRERIDGRLGQ
ncbi:MAG TPA: DinB family protein [Actinospica sp.]|nr:DinB family protein [Actinospica sp.]